MTRKRTLRSAGVFLCALLLFPFFAKAAPLLAAETVGGGGNASFSTTLEELRSLGLPVVEIDTADGGYVTSRIDYKEATMRISLSREYAVFQNTYTDGDGGAVAVKGRGNFSWNPGYADGKKNTPKGAIRTRKVPYTLKLEKKADLFGLGRARTWTLLANYDDRTSMRNKLAYDFSGKLGMIWSRSVFVNLVLNGEYMGVYQVCRKINEKLLADEVTDWEDIAEDAAAAVARAYNFDEAKRKRLEDALKANAAWITGGTVGGYRISDYIDLSSYDPYTGYLLEYDSDANEPSFFRTSHKIPIKVKNLQSVKTNREIYQRLTGFLEEFEAALFSPTFCNSQGKHYSEYLDINSAVDYFLVYIVMMNRELGNRSFYMYLNREGKLVFGPVWDFDHSTGNLFLKKSRKYTVWNDSVVAENNRWYQQLYRDPWFIALVRERWGQIRETAEEILPEIEYWKELLTPSEELEYEKFGGDPYENQFLSRTGTHSFVYEATDLSRFLAARLRWIGTAIGARDPGIRDTDPDVKEKGYEEDPTFTLTVTGVSEPIGLAVPGERPFVADGVSGLQDVLVETALKKGDSVVALLNGEVLCAQRVTDPGGKLALTVPAERFDPGINVITVFRNAGENNKRSVFFSLLMPGEKRTVDGRDPDEAAEPDLPWETAPAETEPPPPPETDPAPDETASPGEPEDPEERGPGPIVFLLPLGAAVLAVLAVTAAALAGKNGKKEDKAK